MSHTRKAIAAVAALALSGSMVASTAPAEAHTYKSMGTVSAKEANRLFKQAFKQKCLTQHEAQHIAHGTGFEQWSDDDLILSWDGTKNSHISTLFLSFDADGCVDEVDTYKS